MGRDRSFVDLPQMVTERLLLRKVTLDDAEDMLTYVSDPEVARYTTWEPYGSIEQVRSHLRSVIENYERGEPANRGVTLRESGHVVGMCGFMAGSWDPEFARASLGYVIAREYRGRGLIPEAVRAAIAFGLGRLSPNRIEARCIAENTASDRVIRKAGLSYEGTLRDRVFREGAYRDYKVYSILRREYRPR